MNTFRRLAPQDFLNFVAAHPNREYATSSRGNAFTCSVSGDAVIIHRFTGGTKRATNNRIGMFCDRFNEARSFNPGDYKHDLTSAASQLVVLADLILRESGSANLSGAELAGVSERDSFSEEPAAMGTRLQQLPGAVSRLFEQLAEIASEEQLGFIYSLVKQRVGQSRFRQELLVAYRSCCAITGCFDEDVLEAAHVVPWCEVGSQSVTNGILLRADIHTLFDCDLIGIDPASVAVRVSPHLRSMDYKILDGVPVNLPLDRTKAPNSEYLALRWLRFSENNRVFDVR